MLLVVLSPEASAADEPSDVDAKGTVTVELVDSDGNPITVPLFDHSHIGFSTVTHEDGTVEFMIQMNTVLDSTPAFLLIHSDGGEFGLEVKMDGLSGTWMDNYGIRVLLDDYTADLTGTNGYSAVFMDGSEEAVFKSNVMYKVSLQVLNGKDAPIIPVLIENIGVTFTWTTSSETHVVVIVVDEDATVFPVHGSFVVPEAPQKEGYSFVTWVDQNGKSHAPGEVIPMTEDLVLVSQWTPKVSYTYTLFAIALIIIPLGVLAAGYKYGVSRVEL